MKQQSEYAARNQTTLDERSVEILHRVQKQVQRLMPGLQPTLSNLIRYSVRLLEEEARVWPDVGPRDQEQVQSLLRETPRCLPKLGEAPAPKEEKSVQKKTTTR